MLKKLLKFFTSRLFLIMFLLLIQLAFLFCLIYKIGEQGWLIYGIFNAFGGLFSIAILNRDFNPAYKISWIIAIIAVPFVGVVFYAFFGRIKLSKKTMKGIERLKEDMNQYYEDNPGVQTFENQEHQKLYNYIVATTKMPAWDNTKTTYLSPGEKYFEVLLEKLKQAKKYIFLEFFIIFPGKMWNEIYDCLLEKVKEGVEVRIIYDDFGCLKKMKKGFKKNLIEKGFKVTTFNPLIPVLSITINYRDHRKIVIIDGEVAFTGGANIGDEYINEERPFNYWKDSMIMIEGKATINMVKIFLQMWRSCTNEIIDYRIYKTDYLVPSSGVVQVFGDGPFDGYTINENVYINLINNAKKYIYIMTPYLILDNEILSALKLSALSGVDVRIVVPHIPDKKTVFLITQSYYLELLNAGVKIYEYLPGFIHSKGIIVDDICGVIGTANFDFRSLYLHFELSCLLYETESIIQIKEDFSEILDVSKSISKEECLKKNKNVIKRVFISILKAFAPMM